MARAERPHTGLSGISSSAFAGILSLVAGIVLLPIIIQTIGSAQYGVWLVLVVVATYLYYSDLGIGAAIVHFSSRARGGDEARTLSQYLSAGLVWNAIVTLIALPLYVLLATLYVNANGAGAGLSQADANSLIGLGTIAIACLLIRPFGSALTGAGLLPIERRNLSVAVVVRTIGTLIACFTVGEIWAVALAETIALILPSVFSLIGVFRRRLVKLSWGSGTFETLKLMLGYSVRSFGVTAIGALILQGGTLIVGVVATPSDVTYFNAAFRIYSSVRQLLSWTVEPFRSALSRLFASSREEADRVLFSLSFATLAASTIGCGVLAFSSHWIVQTWLGSSVPVLEIAATTAILLAGLAINAIHLAFVPAGDAVGRPGVFFVIQVIWLIGFLSLGLWLGMQIGIIGVALALALPLILVEPMYLWKATRIFGFTFNQWFAQVARPAAAILLPGLALVVVYELASWWIPLAQFGWESGLAFLLGVLLTVLVFRKRLPFDHVLRLLKTEL